MGGWQGLKAPGPPPKISSTSPLILVGTVHGDPRGYERAWKLLGYFQPDLVTVEVSRFSLRYRQRQEKRWQHLLRQALQDLPAAAIAHPAIRRLAAQVALPFEVRVAQDFSRSRGIPWRPLDAGGLARRYLPRYSRELLHPDNLRLLWESPPDSREDFVAAEFRRAGLAYRRSPWRFFPGEDNDTLKRERLVARRLQRLARRGCLLMHLGGWEHLVSWEDGSGLTNLLAELKPFRLLLNAADLLPAT